MGAEVILVLGIILVILAAGSYSGRAPRPPSRSGYDDGYGQSYPQPSGRSSVAPQYPPNAHFQVTADHDHLSAADGYPYPGTVITTKKDQRLIKIAFTALGMLIASIIWWKILPWLVRLGVIPGV